MEDFNKDDLIGLDWAKQVLRGEFKANKYVIKECARYVKRMESGQVKDSKGNCYEFDFDEVEFIYGLLSLINYSTGFYANKPILDHIAGFQAMIIENLFGWIHIDNGKRMITDIVLLVGRKSGKSMLCALLEILLMLNGENYEQHGLASSTRDLASIVKRETEQLIKSNKDVLSKRFKIQRDKAICLSNESTMKTVSSQANNSNGLLLTSYIVDEVATLEDHDLIGALRLSQMSTKQKLGIHISTAYDLEINAMKDLCGYHRRMLDGEVEEDIHSFGLIFEMDEGDNYMDEENWIKASPLQMTLEDGIDFMRSEFKKALEVPAKMREFRIKLLNEWLGSYDSEQYIALQDFEKCKIKDYDWYGRDVYLGLDLSMSIDLTAISMLTFDEELGKVVCKSWAFIPGQGIAKKSKEDKINYRDMIENGYCYSCGGRTISYLFVENFIMSLQEEYGVNIQYIGYDQYNAISTVDKLVDNGYQVSAINQKGGKDMPLASKGLKEDVLNDKFAYLDNPLLEQNIVNSREKLDDDLNMRVKKKYSRGRIDMAIATIIAYRTMQIDFKYLNFGQPSIQEVTI